MTGGGASGWGTSSHMSGVSEAFPSGSPGNATTTLTPGGGGGGGGGASLMSEKDRERDSVRQIVTQLRQVSHHTLTYPYLTPSQHIPTYLNCISNLLCVSGLILSISPSHPTLTSYHNPSNLPPPPSLSGQHGASSSSAPGREPRRTGDRASRKRPRARVKRHGGGCGERSGVTCDQQQTTKTGGLR